MSTELAAPSPAPAHAGVRLDLERYRQVSHAFQSTQTEVEKLEHTEAFEGHCHGVSGLRSLWRSSSQGDEENQLQRVPVPA